jgi:hypothetical protein
MGVYLEVVKGDFEPGEDHEEYMCNINHRMCDLAARLVNHVHGKEASFRLLYPNSCDVRFCDKQTHESCPVTEDADNMISDVPHIPTQYPEVLEWFAKNPKGEDPSDDHHFSWVHGYFTPERCGQIYALLQEFPLEWEYDTIKEGFRIAAEGGFWIITG